MGRKEILLPNQTLPLKQPSAHKKSASCAHVSVEILTYTPNCRSCQKTNRRTPLYKIILSFPDIYSNNV